MEELDIQALIDSNRTLGEALKQYVAPENERLKLFLRDSVIQRFEYTYDTAIKIMDKFLEAVGIIQNSKEIFLKERFRMAFSSGILKNDVNTWSSYREMRNKTSHGYYEAIALDVVERIPAFHEEIIDMISRLQEKIGIQ